MSSVLGVLLVAKDSFADARLIFWYVHSGSEQLLFSLFLPSYSPLPPYTLCAHRHHVSPLSSSSVSRYPRQVGGFNLESRPLSPFHGGAYAMLDHQNTYLAGKFLPSPRLSRHDVMLRIPASLEAVVTLALCSTNPHQPPLSEYIICRYI